ncbi:hypothetical protein [Lactobacillus sp. Sy-1]|nr:hypothetical protein [Lactobacillus sp. Sy-1]
MFDRSTSQSNRRRLILEGLLTP